MCTRSVTGFALFGVVLLGTPAAAQPEAAPRPRAFLGVAVEPAREGERGGVTVREVTADSPAAHAGLQPGDVITKVQDTNVNDPDDLTAAVANHKPGEKLTFHVKRDGQDKELSVTLGERPARAAAGREHGGGFLGVMTRPLTAEDKERLGGVAEHGVFVAGVMPLSPAAKAGLRRGDVITAIDGKSVANPADVRQLVQEAGAGKDVTLAVARGKEKTDLKARLEESPVEGITAAQPLGPITSRFHDADKVNDLERRVADLERRVRELEQKRNPPK